MLQIGTKSTITPYAQINVQSGMRYRLRIVGALCTVCPTQLTIDGHKMLIIATDGNPVAPIRVDSLILFSGEFPIINWIKGRGSDRTMEEIA
jgi:FtsP/CotA-like multicopper oxidase with cupredoxin domain